MSEGRLEIGDAKYVSWRGWKISKIGETPGLVMEVKQDGYPAE
jgi:hypothetical protein